MTNQIELAESIARQAHEGQTRWDKKTPYITHPEAIVAALRFHGVTHEHMIATAWLHDVVEDTDITLRQLQEMGVHSQVIGAVDAMTKRSGETYLERIKRARNNPIARVVKQEDIGHNLSDLKKGSMRDKYQLARYILEVGL